jgi:putative ABC transport system permease protein
VAHLLVRTDSPAAVMAAVRKQIQAVDPEQAVAQPRRLEEVVAEILGQPRTTMTMVTVFAAVALLLAAIGIYSVTTYSVAQRTKEIGIRMALGADQAQVRRLVFRQSARVLMMGLLLGAPLSMVAARLYASLLFQAQATDLKTFAGVAVTLSIVTLAASWIPAARAAGVDPVSSLRAD